MHYTNPNCDGDTCQRGDERTVKVMLLAGDANLILCRACWAVELRWRKERNQELEPHCQFPLPTWAGARRYETH